VFKGKWQNSVIHGLGKYSWPEGRDYSGQYVYDRKDGFGTFVWADGRKYEGTWRQGRQHGMGKFTEDGLSTMCMWNDGKREVEGEMQDEGS